MNLERLSVLIVEDEIFAAKYLAGILGSLGCEQIFQAASAKNALDIAASETIDLVFMDINLAGPVDGIECGRTLSSRYGVPIIFTTAYGDTQTIEEAGENTNLYGYLIKPFEADDVEATLRVAFNMLRLKQTQAADRSDHKEVIHLGHEQTYNLDTHIFLIDGQCIPLTKKEDHLLEYFCKNLNRHISYDMLKEHVWQNDDIADSTIRDTVARLKKKAPQLNLKNILNYGYILSR